MGRKKKKISGHDLVKIELKRDDIKWIIDQLGFYGIVTYHKSYNDEIDKRNNDIIKILKRSIVIYPKKIEISPPINLR